MASSAVVRSGGPMAAPPGGAPAGVSPGPALPPPPVRAGADRQHEQGEQQCPTSGHLRPPSSSPRSISSLWGSRRRPELVTCRDHVPAMGMIMAVSLRLVYLILPAPRLADAARPNIIVQGRRAARPTPRGRRAPPGLGRPSPVRRTDPTPTDEPAGSPAGHTRPQSCSAGCWPSTPRTKHPAAPSSPPTASTAPANRRCPGRCAGARAGLRQGPSSTSPRRADQPVRTRSLKPLIRRRG